MNFKSRFPRELLNEIKWKCDGLSKCTIYYINRGSPNDISAAEGSRIIEIDKFSIVLEGIPYDTYIPYHRIVKIEYEDRTIFERNNRNK